MDAWVLVAFFISLSFLALSHIVGTIRYKNDRKKMIERFESSISLPLPSRDDGPR